MNTLINKLKSVFPCWFIQPRVTPTQYYCVICFEEGKVRPCCKTVYCDYDYSKYQSCPNCHNETKEDKLSGAVFMIAPFSEHEECRICLGPGLKRRCCGNYYCDECYYKFPQCRACDKPTTNRGLNQQLKNQASLFTVVLGWVLTLFLVLSLMAVAIMLSVNELATPEGLYDYKCYGFFTECDTPVCVDVDSSITSGSYGSLPSLYEWRKCTLNSTSKLQAQACVFDSELFDLTNGWLGYDVCSDEFAGGAYVFEDTFEHWADVQDFSSNEMVSAYWDDTMNVETNSYCGTGEHNGGSKALVFSGEFFRYAETKDVDVFFGGWIEAELFIAPVGYDVKYPNCKTAYTGHISVEYSVDQGDNWVELGYYEAWRYRQEKFFPIKLEVPVEGRTTATRFRFIQYVFEAERDAWALDNVKVFHKFESDWKEHDEYVEGKKDTPEPMQFAQCCFDTEWCETRLSEDDLHECNDIEWYTETDYQLRGTELFICLAVFFGIVKFIYVSSMDWTMRGRIPFNDELDNLNQVDKLIAMLPPNWRPKKSTKNKFDEIHESARFDDKMRNNLIDDLVEESEEEAARRKREEDKLKAIILANKRKKEKMKKKLAKMKKKREIEPVNLKGSKKLKKSKKAWIPPEDIVPEILVPGMDFMDFEEKSVDDENFGWSSKLDDEGSVESTESIAGEGKGGKDDDDESKKKDRSLRLPVDISDDPVMRLVFSVVVLLLFAVCFLYKSSTQADYTLRQEILVYGEFHGEINIESGGILFFALCCDFKEIYHTLKNVIPISKSWIPPVTLDTTFDVNAMFIGNKTISLQDVTEAHTFTSVFIVLSIVGYGLGCFPWCMFSMIIRDQYLPFDVMRILTPMLGAIVILRSILGPAVFLKSVNAIYSILNLSLKGREDMGMAFKAKKTLTSAINMALGLACGGALLLSVVALNLAAMAFGVFLFVGFMYGAVTGCSHELPIRPWMVITKISDGVWLRVKQKRRCPCVYWGAYCTDMHDANEVFVIFPRDQVLFLSKLKGGV